MKKSTLITTIAMIVVVVVALSTATYAWFSNATQNYVAQNIQVEAQTGLTVLTNTQNLADLAAADPIAFKTTSFDGTTLLEKTQYDSGAKDGIRSGLWTPIADISGVPTSNTTSSSISGASTFLTGRMSAQGIFSFEDEQLTSPDLIIVTNNMSTARKVTLTVYVGADSHDYDKLAAQGVCVYIAGVTAESKVAYTKYGKATYKTSATANSYVAGDYKTASGFTDASGLNHWDNSGAVGVYTSGWTAAATAATNDAANLSGIPNGYKYYTLTYEVCGSLGIGESKVFYVYSWLDGLYLDDYAKNAKISIGFSFGQSDPS